MRKGNREHVLVEALVPKAESNYVDPAPDADTCDVCEFMKDNGGCRRVQGKVKPTATCDLFEEKC